jgi:predicted mannosyl-3-phosphoglycerate phosphatase (HAD superfamily)
MTRIMDSLRQEIEQLRAQLENLQPTAEVSSKDVSQTMSIEDWTGPKCGKSVEVLFTQVDSLTKICNSSDRDKALIAKARCQGLALQFLNGQENLRKTHAVTPS